MSPFQKVIAPQFLNVIETLRRVTTEVRGAPLAAAARIKASCFGLLQKRSRENKERGRESRPSKCHRRERQRERKKVEEPLDCQNYCGGRGRGREGGGARGGAIPRCFANWPRGNGMMAAGDSVSAPLRSARGCATAAARNSAGPGRPCSPSTSSVCLSAGGIGVRRRDGGG